MGRKLQCMTCGEIVDRFRDGEIKCPCCGTIMFDIGEPRPVGPEANVIASIPERDEEGVVRDMECFRINLPTGLGLSSAGWRRLKQEIEARVRVEAQQGGWLPKVVLRPERIKTLIPIESVARALGYDGAEIMTIKQCMDEHHRRYVEIELLRPAGTMPEPEPEAAQAVAG